jgi:hypothetical protein
MLSTDQKHVKIGTHCVHVASLRYFNLASRGAEALRLWLARLRIFKQTDRTTQADTRLFIVFAIPTIQILDFKCKRW